MVSTFRRLASATCVVLIAGLVSTGCTSTSGGGQSRLQLDVLSGDELRATNAANVWDALVRLRPQWLRARGSTSLVAPLSEEPIVYLQGIRHGSVRTLQTMNIDRVRRVEYIDGRDATTRFGTGHGGGVIMVDLDRS